MPCKAFIHAWQQCCMGHATRLCARNPLMVSIPFPQYELVRVGADNLIGEVIRLEGDCATIQVRGLCAVGWTPRWDVGVRSELN